MNEDNQSLVERLTNGYNQLIERIKHTFETVEDQTAPRIRKLIEETQERAVALGELTKEEAERISNYLKRDLDAATEFLSRGDEDTRTWLKFDLELLEDRITDMLFYVADKSMVELADFEAKTLELAVYRSGEITSAGTLACKRCDKHIHFYRTAHIPPCAGCHGTKFKRVIE